MVVSFTNVLNWLSGLINTEIISIHLPNSDFQIFQCFVVVVNVFFFQNISLDWYCTGGSNQQPSIFDHPACFGNFISIIMNVLCPKVIRIDALDYHKESVEIVCAFGKATSRNRQGGRK